MTQAEPDRRCRRAGRLSWRVRREEPRALARKHAPAPTPATCTCTTCTPHAHEHAEHCMCQAWRALRDGRHVGEGGRPRPDPSPDPDPDPDSERQIACYPVRLHQWQHVALRVRRRLRPGAARQHGHTRRPGSGSWPPPGSSRPLARTLRPCPLGCGAEPRPLGPPRCTAVEPSRRRRPSACFRRLGPLRWRTSRRSRRRPPATTRSNSTQVRAAPTPSATHPSRRP